MSAKKREWVTPLGGCDEKPEESSAVDIDLRSSVCDVPAAEALVATVDGGSGTHEGGKLEVVSTADEVGEEVKEVLLSSVTSIDVSAAEEVRVDVETVGAVTSGEEVSAESEVSVESKDGGVVLSGDEKLDEEVSVAVDKFCLFC